MEADFRHWIKKVIATFYLTIVTFYIFFAIPSWHLKTDNFLRAFSILTFSQSYEI